MISELEQEKLLVKAPLQGRDPEDHRVPTPAMRRDVYCTVNISCAVQHDLVRHLKYFFQVLLD